jgi:hypothetical protein
MNGFWIILSLCVISNIFATEPKRDEAVHLTGKEVEALLIATADFKQKHYSV